MIILVASGYHQIQTLLEDRFAEEGKPVPEIDSAKTIDEFIEKLKRHRYDFIVTEYIFDGVDIWSLSKLLNSHQFSKHKTPVILAVDDEEDDIPKALAFLYNIETVNIEKIAGFILNEATSESCYLKKPSLLVIEDDQDNADLINFNLKGDFKIEVSNSGEKGLESWKKKRHQLVLLDYMLPGIQGNTVLEEILTLDENQPVIIMKAYGSQEKNIDMILNGASDYIGKPFQMGELKKLCHKTLYRAQLIYQTCHWQNKVYKLGVLLGQLDSHIEDENLQMAQRTMQEIKLIAPIQMLD